MANVCFPTGPEKADSFSYIQYTDHITAENDTGDTAQSCVHKTDTGSPVNQ